MTIFATPSFYDQVAGGRATRLPFAIEIRAAPQWKKMAERSRHLISFLNRNPRVGTFTLRLRHICATKGIPCAFLPSKGKSTRAKREQNVRNMRVYPAPDYTAPAPFSPSLTRVLPMPLSRRDNVLVLCKKLSKFYEPPLKWFEFFHQVYINLPLSGKVNKRKYRKPSKTVK